MSWHRNWGLFWILVLVAGLLNAVPTRADPDVVVDRLFYEERLPAKRLEALRQAPQRMLEDAAELILGYGARDGLRREGIVHAIALQRAYVRAREMRRLLLADLDGDGALRRRELDVLIAASGARARGRLLMAFDVADGDRDGTVSARELMGWAQAEAMREVSQADEILLLSFMAFDIDGNGAVTLAEIRAAIEVFRQDA